MKSRIPLMVLMVVLAGSAVRCAKQTPTASTSSDTTKPAAMAAAATSTASATAMDSATTTKSADFAPQPTISAVSSDPQVRAKLDSALAEAAHVLDARDYAGFLKEFLPPEFAANLPPGMPLDQAVQRMTQDDNMITQMTKLLTSLQLIQKQKIVPTMSTDGNTATYDVTLVDGTKVNVVFKKTATGLWYPEM